MASPLSQYINDIVHQGGVDLHLHSTFSDGSATPKEIAHLTHKAQLRVFSLTDHDSVRGTFELQTELDVMRVQGYEKLPEFIPGLELSLTYEGEEIHVLAYFKEWSAVEDIRPFLKAQGKSRDERNEAMVSRLQSLRIPISLEELNALTENKVSRLHMAHWLMDHGFAQDINHAFQKYLSREGLAYVKRERVDLTSGIAALKKVNAAIFLAHPQQYQWGLHEPTVRKHFAELRAAGLDGIEAFHGEAHPIQQKMYYDIAKELHMPVSAGSDWHGHYKENRPHYTGNFHFLDNMKKK